MLEVCTETYAGLHVKHLLLSSNFNKNWIVLTNFSKIPNIKLHENHAVILKQLRADRHIELICTFFINFSLWMCQTLTSDTYTELAAETALNQKVFFWLYIVLSWLSSHYKHSHKIIFLLSMKHLQALIVWSGKESMTPDIVLCILTSDIRRRWQPGVGGATFIPSANICGFAWMISTVGKINIINWEVYLCTVNAKTMVYAQAYFAAVWALKLWNRSFLLGWAHTTPQVWFCNA